MSSIPFHSSDKRPLSSSFLSFHPLLYFIYEAANGKTAKGPREYSVWKDLYFIDVDVWYYHWDKFFSKMAKERKRKTESKEQTTNMINQYLQSFTWEDFWGWVKDKAGDQLGVCSSRSLVSSSPHLATSSTRKFLTALTSHWDSIMTGLRWLQPL